MPPPLSSPHMPSPNPLNKMLDFTSYSFPLALLSLRL